MKCPYRKITYHHKAYAGHCASDEEGFAKCYEKECPYYYKGINTFDNTEYEECKRVETAVWEATHPYQDLTR